MAETSGAASAIPPNPVGAREAREIAVIAPAATAFPGASGQPIGEPPPLIEPLGYAERPIETRSLAVTQRPVRRRFLAPVANPGMSGPDRLALRDIRPRVASQPQFTVLSGDAFDAAAPPPGVRLTVAATTATPPIVAPPTVESPQPAPQPSIQSAPAAARPGRRRALVGLAIAAVLALVVAATLRTHPEWQSRLREAVLQGLPGSPALLNGGRLPTDPAQRFAYDMQRAKAGDGEAQLAVAIHYAKGEGISRDFTAAAKWFVAAAENGVVRAQYDAAVLYERGRGVPLDYARAIAWYRKAAEQNYPLAQYNLAVAYTKGEGVERNMFEAAVWYNRAAAQGVVAAMVNLAILYERGEGVEASTAHAYAWYRAAARRGSQPASQRADELLQAFSPWEQTQAEARTTDIAASIQDSIGERLRNPAVPTQAAATNVSAPNLRSGLGGDPVSAQGGETEDQSP